MNRLVEHFRSRPWRWVMLLALLGSLFMSSTLQAASDNLVVSVSDYRGSATPGEELTYTVRVANNGSSDITGVTASITLPSEVTFVGTYGGLFDEATRTVTWSDIGTLTPGRSGLRYVTVMVNAVVVDRTKLITTASANDSTGGVAKTATDETDVMAPTVELTPASLTFDGLLIGTTSEAKSVTLKNTGSANLSVTSITTTGDFAVATGTGACAVGTLAPQASCTIYVTFTPTAGGTRTGELVIADNGLDAQGVAGPHKVTLTGTGLAPAVTLNPTSLTFGDQVINTTSSPQSVTVTNSGTAPLRIDTVTFSNAAFEQTSTTCPVGSATATLAVGASCVIQVVFKPTTTGANSADLTITTNASNSPHTVSLTGNGTERKLSLNPTTLTFTTQQVNTTSGAQQVTVTNSGTAPVTISGLSFSGANAADFAQISDCVKTLDPAATCTINVTFTPKAEGTRSATLTVANNSGNSYTVSLTGNAVAPTYTLAPASITFPDTVAGQTSVAQTVTLTNGTLPLKITSITASTNFAIDPATTTCPTNGTVTAGSTCTIGVVFKPTVGGDLTGKLTITSDAASATTNQVSLSGKGLAPAVTLTPSTLSFSGVNLNTTSAPQTITLTNSGNAVLNISAITTSGDYAQTSDCGATLDAQSSCTITVTFTPTAAGARPGTLTITSDAAGSPHTLNLTGTGLAPVYSSAPATGFIRLSSVVNASNSVTIQVSNTGTAQLDVSQQLDPINPPFSIAPDTAYSLDPSTTQQKIVKDIVVTCSPTTLGQFTQSLRYTTNDPAKPSVTYTITCNSTAAPTATYNSTPATGGTLDMGDVRVGQASTTGIIISEAGTADLQVGLNGGSLATAITGANASDFTITEPTFPLTIADGTAAKTVTIQCKPSAEGQRTATLQFTTNDPSQPTVTYTLRCNGLAAPTLFTVYGPMISGRATTPDLTATLKVSATTLKAGAPVQIEATVTNNGEAAAGGFWVDLYINPSAAPTSANTPWNEVCGINPCYGIAWYVAGPLAPGQSVTLTSTPDSYFAKNTNWLGTFAAGTTDLYLYVDSWNRDTQSGSRVASGAVTESNETNNRAEVHGLTVTGTTTMSRTDVAPEAMPVRPNHP